MMLSEGSMNRTQLWNVVGLFGVVACLAACPAKQEKPVPTTKAPVETVTPATPETAPAETEKPVVEDVATPVLADTVAPVAKPIKTDKKPRTPALTDADKAELKQKATAFKTHLNAGRAKVKAGEVEVGVALYRKALALNPRNASVLGELGYALLQVGQHDDAEHFTMRAVEFSRNDRQLGALWYNAALIADKRGDRVQAVSRLKTSLKLRANKTVEAKLGEILAAGEVAKPDDTRRTFSSIAFAEDASRAAYMNYAQSEEDECDGAEAAGALSVGHTELKAPVGNVIEAAAIVTTGGRCGNVAPAGYDFAHLLLKTKAGWVEMPRLYAHENSGCCGAHREAEIKLTEFRDVVPGGGAELIYHYQMTDQDSDMGVDQIWFSQVQETRVCGVTDAGKAWCRSFNTYRLEYDAGLEAFHNGAGEPSCAEVVFDGKGNVTRKPNDCGAPPAPRGEPTVEVILLP
ncbi:MAG: Flp pilus assembly protein TadD [Myxococcota bacterium]|jgi:Flp pilus assembly protein TadD